MGYASWPLGGYPFGDAFAQGMKTSNDTISTLADRDLKKSQASKLDEETLFSQKKRASIEETRSLALERMKASGMPEKTAEIIASAPPDSPLAEIANQFATISPVGLETIKKLRADRAPRAPSAAEAVSGGQDPMKTMATGAPPAIVDPAKKSSAFVSALPVSAPDPYSPSASPNEPRSFDAYSSGRAEMNARGRGQNENALQYMSRLYGPEVAASAMASDGYNGKPMLGSMNDALEIGMKERLNESGVAQNMAQAGKLDQDRWSDRQMLTPKIDVERAKAEADRARAEKARRVPLAASGGSTSGRVAGVSASTPQGDQSGDVIDVGGRKIDWSKLNPAQQSTLARFLSSQQASQVRGESGEVRQGQQTERGLRNEFANSTKSYRSVRDSYNRINAAATSPESGVSDIAIVYGYMKMLDPESVVREGEFATAENAGGIPDKVRVMYNKVVNGERLSSDVRGQMVDMAKTIFEVKAKDYGRQRSQFEGLARNYGVKPENVVLDIDADSEPTSVEPQQQKAAPVSAGALRAWAQKNGRTFDDALAEYEKKTGLKVVR